MGTDAAIEGTLLDVKELSLVAPGGIYPADDCGRCAAHTAHSQWLAAHMRTFKAERNWQKYCWRSSVEAAGRCVKQILPG